MQNFTVLELRVDFKYDLEDVIQQALPRIVKAVGRWCKPVRHAKASVSFVVLSTETAVELLRRLRPALEDISSVDNYWVHFAPRSAVAKAGGLDPYVHWLDTAWKEAGKRGESQNMRHSQRRGFTKG